MITTTSREREREDAREEDRSAAASDRPPPHAGRTPRLGPEGQTVSGSCATSTLLRDRSASLCCVARRVVMSAAPALSSAAEAALRAEFSQRWGRFVLSKTLVVNVLVTFLAARGEGINDLPFLIDRDDEESWEDEWRQIAASAGIADDLDQQRLIMWLRAKNRPAVAASGATGASHVALTALEKVGVTITNDQAAAMQAAMTTAEAGAARAQCTSTLCVFLMYFGRPGSEEETERYERELNALGWDPTGTVRITSFESYAKLLNKSNVIVLERALKSLALWRDYKPAQGALLATHGLDKAALQWNKVTTAAELTAPDDPPMQLAYLRGYFSSEFLGRGMPEIRGVQSALTILGSIRGHWSDHARNLFMIPTVPTAFDLALSGGGQSRSLLSRSWAPRAARAPSAA